MAPYDPKKAARLAEVFKAMDKDGNGFVELWEMCDIIESAQDDTNELLAYAESKSLSLDANGDGTISTDEFTAALQSDTVYRNFLWSGVTTVPPQHIRTLAAMNTEELLGANAMNLETLTTLWENILLNTRCDSFPRDRAL